jgi:hypothetical protein
MIYKPYTPPPAQQQSFMDPAQQELWDRWCDSRIRCAVNGIADALGPLHRKLHDEIEKLRTELDALRAEVNENKNIQSSATLRRLGGMA